MFTFPTSLINFVENGKKSLIQVNNLFLKKTLQRNKVCFIAG